MNTRRTGQVLTAAAGAVLLLAACSSQPTGTDEDDPPPPPPPESHTYTPTPERTISPGDLAILKKDADSAVYAVDRFWSDHWSEYFTGTYDGPTVKGFYEGTDGPTCGGKPPVADNAFYCIPEDYVAWDVNLLGRRPPEDNAWVFLIIAHEWGHVIQDEVPPVKSGDPELQADCLAGAAIYGSAADGVITYEPSDEKVLTKSLTDLADETAWTDSSDHGDPFERITAFNLGRTGGVTACFPKTETQ